MTGRSGHKKAEEVGGQNQDVKGLVGFHPEDHERPLMGFGQSHLGASAQIHFSSPISPLPKDSYTSLARAKKTPLTHVDGCKVMARDCQASTSQDQKLQNVCISLGYSLLWKHFHIFPGKGRRNCVLEKWVEYPRVGAGVSRVLTSPRLSAFLVQSSKFAIGSRAHSCPNWSFSGK